MPNKLQNIFSDEMPEMGITFHFKDTESHEFFWNALKIAHDEGRPVEIGDISSISTELHDGNHKYPLEEIKNITKVEVALSTEDIPIVVNTKYGKRKIVFIRKETSKEIIFETSERAIVYFKIVFKKNTANVIFTFNVQPSYARKIKDIAESYCKAIALLDIFFNYSNVKDTNEDALHDYELVCKAKKDLEQAEAYCMRVQSVETAFGLHFNLAKMEKPETDAVDIETLYTLFLEDKAIRLNAKIDAGKLDSKIRMPHTNVPSEGENIDITFLKEVKYHVLGQGIQIYTANLLSNVVVKKVVEHKDSTTEVFYGDTDSKPMYISYTAAKTREEAEEMHDNIMENKSKYINANTIEEHIKRRMNDKNRDN